MSMQPQPSHERAHRVIASLNRDQVDFLDRLGKDALFSCGTKLSRTDILSAMVNVMRQLSFSGEDITSGKELECRIVQAMKEQAADASNGRGDAGGSHA
jgi:hypothetical protein